MYETRKTYYAQLKNIEDPSFSQMASAMQVSTKTPTATKTQPIPLTNKSANPQILITSHREFKEKSTPNNINKPNPFSSPNKTPLLTGSIAPQLLKEVLKEHMSSIKDTLVNTTPNHNSTSPNPTTSTETEKNFSISSAIPEHLANDNIKIPKKSLKEITSKNKLN